MQVSNVLHTARLKYRMQKWRKNAICAPLHNFVRQSGKKFLNSNISYRCPHNMANFGPLMAVIFGRFSSSGANSNGFLVLTLLLQLHRSPQANQTLHDVWPSHGTLYIHFWGLLAPDGILPCAKFAMRPSLAFSYIGSVTARHSSSGWQSDFAAWYKEWNYGNFVQGAIYIWLICVEYGNCCIVHCHRKTCHL